MPQLWKSMGRRVFTLESIRNYKDSQNDKTHFTYVGKDTKISNITKSDKN